MASAQSLTVQRRDLPSRPPNLAVLGARIGAMFGALFGVYGAITNWLAHESALSALRSWFTTGLASGCVFGVLYPIALVVAAKSRSPAHAIASTRQSSELRLTCAPHEALALATSALGVLHAPVRQADLVRGTARIEQETRQPLFGTVRFDVVATVRADGADSIVEVSTQTAFSPYDLGGAREAVDRVCDRFVELADGGTLPRDARPMSALPSGAAALLTAQRMTLGALRDLQPDVAALIATLYAANGETRRVLVVPVPRETTTSEARKAASQARAAGAAHARGGAGFALVPLEDGEDVRKIARRFERALASGGSGYRGSPAQQAATKNERRRKGDDATTRSERPAKGDEVITRDERGLRKR